MNLDYEATVAENVAQAREFLSQSDAEFEAGDIRQAAKKLYGAATQAVIAASHQGGWSYRSHRDNKNATDRLATEYRDESLYLGFLAAERFHIHFHHGDLEDYEIDSARPRVHRFVNRLLALVEERDE